MSPDKRKGYLTKDKLTKGKVSINERSRECGQNSTKPLKARNGHPSKANLAEKDIVPLGQTMSTEPETPAPLPIESLTPFLYEQSADHPNLRDTPPPAGLNASSSLAGRASRRPRGSVSYAEPNLRDKMRRPTKDLVDAVGADDRLQIIKIKEIKPAAKDANIEKERTLIVKREDPEDEPDSAWKKLPLSNETSMELGSPLGRKTSSVNEILVDPAPNTRRSDHSKHTDDEIKSSSTSRSTIAALAAGSQKSRRRDDRTLDRKITKSRDLFDFHTSSPHDSMPDVEPEAPTRTSRRHSSMVNAADLHPKGTSIVGSTSTKGDRRRLSTLHSRKMREQRDGGNELKTVESVGELHDPALTTDQGRSERSASRRRSMML